MNSESKKDELKNHEDSLLNQGHHIQENENQNNSDDEVTYKLKTDAFTLVKASLWQGSYPSPEDMKKYAEIFPNSPEILFAEYQKQNEHIRKQGQHRQTLEKTVINFKQKNARLGQIFIFIICVLSVIISGIDIVYNQGNSAKYIMGCLFGFGVLSIISGQAIEKVERKKRLNDAEKD